MLTNERLTSHATLVINEQLNYTAADVFQAVCLRPSRWCWAYEEQRHWASYSCVWKRNLRSQYATTSQTYDSNLLDLSKTIYSHVFTACIAR